MILVASYIFAVLLISLVSASTNDSLQAKSFEQGRKRASTESYAREINIYAGPSQEIPIVPSESRSEGHSFASSSGPLIFSPKHLPENKISVSNSDFSIKFLKKPDPDFRADESKSGSEHDDESQPENENDHDSDDRDDDWIFNMEFDEPENQESS